MRISVRPSFSGSRGRGLDLFKTVLRKLELIIRERRLRWLGHVLRIDDSRIPRQATQWEQEKAGTPKEKLDGHHQKRFEGHGHHLG